MQTLADVKLSLLDLAPIKLNGSPAQTFAESVTLAQKAEQFGYHRFWLAEHHNIDGIASAATSVLIGHIAGHTSTIRVGSGGIMLPNHPPLVIAEQFGTLETLYPNRIDLGLGRAPGSDGVTMQAMRRDPRAGVNDFPDRLEELRRYLDDSEPGQRVRAIPGQGTHVPIWLLGSSLYSAQLAAQLGLPFAFAGQFAPEQMYEAIRLYKRNFTAGTLDKPYAMIGLPVVIADSDEKARLLATTAQQKFLNMARGKSNKTRPPVERMDWNLQEEAFVAERLGALVCGGPERAREQIDAIIAQTEADEVMAVTDCYDVADRIRSYELLSEIWKQNRIC